MVEQIVFPSEADATGRIDKIKAGATFDSIAAERKLTARTSISANVDARRD